MATVGEQVLAEIKAIGDRLTAIEKAIKEMQEILKVAEEKEGWD